MTSYGRKRLAWHLFRQEKLILSPHTIQRILRRQRLTNRVKLRKRFYPAHWAWEEERPFFLAQVDLKDVLDKGTLGTELWDWMGKRKPPRYQWTFLEGRTRLRFLAWSFGPTLTNALRFMSLCMLCLGEHRRGGQHSRPLEDLLRLLESPPQLAMNSHPVARAPGPRSWRR